MKKYLLLAFAACLMVGSVAAQTETNRMLNNALGFLNTPYVAQTLDVLDEEELIINADEVDCTTFVEYVLAMSLCTDQGDEMLESEFAEKLQNIRYRDGEIDGYTSRLHYITEWISDNVKKGNITDVTERRSKETISVNVNYMSTHPASYAQLANSPANVEKMKAIERSISGQRVHYIPKENLPMEGLPWIKNGDIIVFTTNIDGLDVTHMGIAIYVKDNLHLLHASSKHKKVVVEPLVLNRQLNNNKSATGIRVLRMKG